MLFFATITQQRRPGCCGCLFVVRFVFVFFKEEEEEEEDAILVGVVDDDVATENMTTRMIICVCYVCVFLCFSARRYNGEFDTFFHLTTTLITARKVSPSKRLQRREERERRESDFVRRSNGAVVRTVFE